MSFSDSAEYNLMKLILQNVPWAGIGDSSGLQGSAVAGDLFVSLHTADPGEAGAPQTTSETSYPGYARFAVARSSGGWTVTPQSGGTPTTGSNAAPVAFPQCSATPNSQIKYFAVGKALTGTGEIVFRGAIPGVDGNGLLVSPGVTPSFAAGQLTFTLD